MRKEMLIKKPIENVSSKVFDAITRTIGTTLIHTMEITWFGQCINLDVIKKYFPHLPYRLDFMTHNNRRVGRGRFGGRLARQIEIDWDKPMAEGTYYDIYFYKGTPIVLSFTGKYWENQRELRDVWKLHTFNRKKNRNMLVEFYEHLMKETYKVRKNEGNSDMQQCLSGGGWMTVARPQRSFDDVFIEDDVQERLISTIDQFIKSEKWYKEHRIPYHFGVLLHGQPGTGKSSVVQALINQWSSHVFVMSASNMNRLEDMIQNIGKNEFSPKIRFVIVEDVDTADFSDTRDLAALAGILGDKKSEAAASGREVLGQVLNAMDGLSAGQGVIYVFTTNHLEQLDPALIRPGRIDMIEEIGYVSDTTMNKFLKFHYGKELPKDVTVRSGLTFAEIQTNVMMRISFDKLISRTCERKLINVAHMYE